MAALPLFILSSDAGFIFTAYQDLERLPPSAPIQRPETLFQDQQLMRATGDCSLQNSAFNLQSTENLISSHQTPAVYVHTTTTSNYFLIPQSITNKLRIWGGVLPVHSLYNPGSFCDYWKHQIEITWERPGSEHLGKVTEEKKNLSFQREQLNSSTNCY